MKREFLKQYAICKLIRVGFNVRHATSKGSLRFREKTTRSC